MGIEDDLNKDRNVIPQGKIIGQDIKGGELRTWYPLHFAAGSTLQQLKALEGDKNVYPLSPIVSDYIARLPNQGEERDVSTCIASIDQLWPGYSPSAKDLADPRLLETWSKQLQGHEFESLPQRAILQAVIQAGKRLPISRYGIHKNVYTLGSGSGSILYAYRDPENNKATVSMRDNNTGFRWNTGDYVLLGVRRSLNKA